MGTSRASSTLLVDRSLLNANFDGYKLSFENVPRVVQSKGPRPDVLACDAGHFSFNYVRLFQLHNHLFADPHAAVPSAYYVDAEWNVIRCVAEHSTGIHFNSVFSIPGLDRRTAVRDALPPTLHFPSADVAVIADGAGALHVVDRSQPGTWAPVFSSAEAFEGKPFMLIACSVHAGGWLVRCTAQAVFDSGSSGAAGSTEREARGGRTELRVFDIAIGADGAPGRLLLRGVLRGKDTPRYASIDPEGGSLVLIGTGAFRVQGAAGVEGSSEVTPMEVDNGGQVDVSEERRREAPPYEWSQTDDEVVLRVVVDASTRKADVSIVTRPDALTVSVKGKAVANGSLGGRVLPAETVWTLSDGVLEVTLAKADRSDSGELSRWPCFVQGDGVEETLSIESVAVAREALEKYTSELESAPTDRPGAAAARLGREIEECDAESSEDVAMSVFSLPPVFSSDGNGDDAPVVLKQTVNFGSHGFLFLCALQGEPMSGFCAQYNVDALVYAVRGRTAPSVPSSDEGAAVECAHVATFSALGYVQASKREKKFLACAPDCAYAALCESNRHVFLYMQAKERRASNAKQFVVTLDDEDEGLVGCAALRGVAFIMAAPGAVWSIELQ